MERLAALRAQIAELEADSDDSDLSEVDLGKHVSQLGPPSTSTKVFDAVEANTPECDDVEYEVTRRSIDSPVISENPEDSESSEESGDDGTFLAIQRRKWQEAKWAEVTSTKQSGANTTVTIPTTSEMSRTSKIARDISLPNCGIPTTSSIGIESGYLSAQLAPIMSQTKASYDASHPSIGSYRTPSQPSIISHLSVAGSSTTFTDTNCLLVNGHRYHLLNELGRGGSSKVYQVFDELRKICLAIKIVNLEDTDEQVVAAYQNEIQLLKKLQHVPCVIKMFDYEYKADEQKLFVVMEKGDTDLAGFFKSRKNSDVDYRHKMIQFYWLEMLRAVQVIHNEGIVHSDLKPSNFVLVAGELKLIDFGIANAVPSNKTSVTKYCQMGTLNYMSPEAVQNASGSEGIKFRVNQKSDVWSLGVILYSLVYGKTPFQHITNMVGKVMAIINPQCQIEFKDVGDQNLLDVMKKCLERDQKKRPSIDELLQHPYVKSSGENRSSVGGVAKLSDDHLRSMLSVLNTQSPRTGLRMLKSVLGSKPC